jgi:Lon protease (S16) C-terminal proteolytic domain.
LKPLEIVFVEHMDEVLKIALDLADPESLFKEAPFLDVWQLVKLEDQVSQQGMSH